MFERLRDIFRRREDLPESGDGPFVVDGEAEDLIRELRALGEIESPAGSRERTWALLRNELEQQKARGAFGPARSRLRGLGYGRVVLGAAAVMLLAAVAGIIGLSGDPDQVVYNPSTSTSVTVEPGTSTSDTLVPSSTLPSDSSTTTQAETTEMAPPTSETTVPTTQPTTPSTTAGTEPEPRTTTTAGQTTTTTSSEPKLTREQRESSASSRAKFLARKVVLGDLDGARKLVTGSASAGLAMMVATLNEPSDVRVMAPILVGDSGVTRVLVEFYDRRDDGQGNLVDFNPRFYFDITVDEDGAVVTGIYKAPS
ncbi:MAG: hypothetical protein M5U22_14425 [Thermoleophilia bacterium]|nr:hypothetical protein [Thermoleophilia bacterium]